MSAKNVLISLIGLLCIPFSCLYADIIVTNDDMILNGKILEKKPVQIIFGNYHGIFTIERAQIKEIHETKSFKEDVLIFQKKGKRVDENEVKKNFQAGLEKLKDRERDKGGDTTPPARYTFLLTPSYMVNIGKLGAVMPHSAGVSLTGDIPLRRLPLTEKTGITGIRSEAGYFYLKNGAKTVQGPRLSSGPLWEFPFSIGDIRCTYSFSPVLGIGWYTIEGRTEKTAALKWHAGCITGPAFFIQNTVLFPQLRFDYIHDGSVPLYGIGFGLGLGYRFSM